MPTYIVLAGLAALLLVLPLLWWIARSRRRDASLVRLLDLADEVQGLLDRSLESMQAMQAVVGRVPSDIAAVARASLDSTQSIRDAKRDVLQHRLWIQKHGETATQAELDAACAALDRARARLSTQLAELERAGAELAQATEASAEAARREPATLRRDPDAP
jgi:septal ring factor EnvC (AmiA/AmiB activator)